MGLKPDTWIARMVENYAMIDPFVDHQEHAHDVSYGLTAAGYDIRIGREFMVAKENGIRAVRPGKVDPNIFYHYTDEDKINIPPYGFVLACSLEHFIMPSNVIGTCVGKSTLARSGLHVLVTPLEPGWCGQLTIEVCNMLPRWVELYAGIGIAQLQFTELDSPPAVTYADRPGGGKYQGQVGVTLARGNST